MTKILFPVRVLLFSLLLVSVTIGTASICSASPGDEKTKPSRSTTHATTDLVGTWTGTFFSKHENVAAFTMTVVVAPDSQGQLIGTSTLNSDCLKDVRLEVSVKGSQVTFAGSDEEGNNITVRGTRRRHGHNAEGQLHSEWQRFGTVRSRWRHRQSGETIATCLRAYAVDASGPFLPRPQVHSDYGRNGPVC